MALVKIPARTSVELYGGGTDAVGFGNSAGSPIDINTTDPKVDGGLIKLGYGESVIFDAGTPMAAAAWFGYSSVGADCTVTVFPTVP